MAQERSKHQWSADGSKAGGGSRGERVLGGRIKNLFRSSKDANAASAEYASAKTHLQDGTISPSLWNQLSCDREPSVRLKAFEALDVELTRRRFASSTLKALWFAIQDVFACPDSTDGEVVIVQQSTSSSAHSSTTGVSVGGEPAQQLTSAAVRVATTLCRSQAPQLDEHLRRVQLDALVRLATQPPAGAIATQALVDWLRAVTADAQAIAGVEDCLPTSTIDWLALLLLSTTASTNQRTSTDVDGSRPRRATDEDSLLVIAFICDLLHSNAAFVTEHQVCRLLALVCTACWRADASEAFAHGCLALVDDVLCYSSLPEHSVHTVVTLNCYLVFRQGGGGTRSASLPGACWKVMRSVLRSHWGYSAANALCGLLQHRDAIATTSVGGEGEGVTTEQQEAVLVGAVYFLGMALWGHGRVDTLRYSPCVVLASFASVLDRLSPPSQGGVCPPCPPGGGGAVAFEIVNALYRLVGKYGRSLVPTTWHLVLRILALVCQRVVGARAAAAPAPPTEERLAARFHDILDMIEQVSRWAVAFEVVNALYRLVGKYGRSLVPTTWHLVLRILALVCRRVVGARAAAAPAPPTEERLAARFHDILDMIEQVSRWAVAFEVVNALYRLVGKYGRSLVPTTWHLVLRILALVCRRVVGARAAAAPAPPTEERLAARFHDILDMIEQVSRWAVAFEVVNALYHLVGKYGRSLVPTTWHLVLRILALVCRRVVGARAAAAPAPPTEERLAARFHDILDMIEQVSRWAVAFEVVNALYRLVGKYGRSLVPTTWHLVLRILALVFRRVVGARAAAATAPPTEERLAARFHDILDMIEQVSRWAVAFEVVNALYRLVGKYGRSLVPTTWHLVLRILALVCRRVVGARAAAAPAPPTEERLAARFHDILDMIEQVSRWAVAFEVVNALYRLVGKYGRSLVPTTWHLVLRILALVCRRVVGARAAAAPAPPTEERLAARFHDILDMIEQVSRWAVAFEVVNALYRLVGKYGRSLVPTTWHLVLRILALVCRRVVGARAAAAPAPPTEERLAARFHDILDMIEQVSRWAVAFEVVNALYRLLGKYGRSLVPTTWHLVLRIRALVCRRVVGARAAAAPAPPTEERLAARFHNILDMIEQLDEEGRFAGSAAQLFAVIDACSAWRPERSVLRMIEHNAASISPQRHDWLDALGTLLQKYFHGDHRGNVRIKAVNVFRNVFTAQRRLFPDKILMSVLTPLFADLPRERDAELSNLCLNTLFDVLRTLPIDYRQVSTSVGGSASSVSVNDVTTTRAPGPDNIETLLDVLQKLLRAGTAEKCRVVSGGRRSTSSGGEEWSSFVGDGEWSSAAVFEYADTCMVIVCGLSELLHERWTDLTPAHIRRVLYLFCELLDDLYQSSATSSSTDVSDGVATEAAAGVTGSQRRSGGRRGRQSSTLAGVSLGVFDDVRRRLWRELLTLRVDWRAGGKVGRLRLADHDGDAVFSNYLRVHDDDDAELHKPSDSGDTFVWTRIGETLELCFANERSWPVFLEMLNRLQSLLLNGRRIVLSDKAALDSLCLAMLRCIADPRRSKQFVELATTNATVEQSLHLTEADIADHLCPCLSSLLSFKNALPTDTFLRIITAIQRSMVCERSVKAVRATSVCLLAEWSSSSSRLSSPLRLISSDLVDRLAELAAGPRLAIHALELASLLVESEGVNEVFEERHYRRVCDIAVPYLNVAKYTTFIVAVALQLMMAVFVLAPLNIRAALLKYTVKELRDRRACTQSNKRRSNAAGEDDDDLKQQQIEVDTTLAAFLQHRAYTDAPLVTPAPPCADGRKQLAAAAKHWLVGDRIVSMEAFGVDAGDGGSNDRLTNTGDDSTKLARALTEGQHRKGTSVMPATQQSPDSPASPRRRRRHQSAMQPPSTATSAEPLARQGGLRPGEGAPGAGGAEALGNTTQESRGLVVDRPKFVDDSAIDFMAGGNAASPRSTDVSVDDEFTNTDVIVHITIRHPFGSAQWRVHKGAPDLIDSTSGTPDIDDKDASQLGCPPLSFCDPVIPPVEASLRSCPTSSARFETLEGGGAQGGTPGPPGDVARGDVSGLKTILQTSDWSLNTTNVRRSSSHFKKTRHEPCESLFNRLFMQLCQGHVMSSAVVVSGGDGGAAAVASMDRSLRTLDLLSPIETHTIAVVYIAPGQTTEADILANQFGSDRYHRFLDALGQRIALPDGRSPMAGAFTGGLTTPKDGVFTYAWNDPVTQVVFHVATLMPNTGSDGGSSSGTNAASQHGKKLHIGNDFVTVVYNDSGADYSLGTISGKFAHCAVVVEPRDTDALAVTLQAKDEISRWLSVKRVVLCDDGGDGAAASAARLCRRMAVRADTSARVWLQQQQNTSSSVPTLGSQTSQRRPPPRPYLCRAVERRRHILTVKQRFAGAAAASPSVASAAAKEDPFACFDVV